MWHHKLQVPQTQQLAEVSRWLILQAVIFYTSFLNVFINYANTTVLSQYNNFHSDPVIKIIYSMLYTTRLKSFENCELLRRYCLLLNSKWKINLL